jgi:hypothetical protein
MRCTVIGCDKQKYDIKLVGVGEDIIHIYSSLASAVPKITSIGQISGEGIEN